MAAASAADRGRHRADPSGGQRSCVVKVLYSEELPGAPIFHNFVRAWLLVTPGDGTPFEIAVEKLIPWQVPPPRRGQRLKMPCDPLTLNRFPLEWTQ